MPRIIKSRISRFVSASKPSQLLSASERSKPLSQQAEHHSRFCNHLVEHRIWRSLSGLSEQQVKVALRKQKIEVALAGSRILQSLSQRAKILQLLSLSAEYQGRSWPQAEDRSCSHSEQNIPVALAVILFSAEYCG
jgi:hypothetical protein